jgi:protease I
MDKELTGKKILLLVANGVEEASMSTVQRDLLKAGATFKTVAIENGLVNSWNGTAWGLYFPVDQSIGQTLGADFDALVVPAGSRGAQKLAGNPHSGRIISGFSAAQKPMAFIDDAVFLLDKTGVEKGTNVLTGGCANLIAHLAGVQTDVKAAA